MIEKERLCSYHVILTNILVINPNIILIQKDKELKIIILSITKADRRKAENLIKVIKINLKL